MARRTGGEIRAEVVARARAAFREGLSASRFITEMRAEGLGYRRTTMLADWRSVGEIEKKADAFKYVRKDYYPSKAVMAQVEWAMSREFMYKVKVQSRIRPDEPITERFVNIMQDRPLTRAEVEAMAWELVKEQSPKKLGQVVSLTGWTAVQRITD